MDELVPDERMSCGAPALRLGGLVLWLLLVAVLTAIVAWECLTRWIAARTPQGPHQARARSQMDD
jgi:hypothetical protein